MKIRHTLGKEKRERIVDGRRSFLLGNDKGDYLWMSEFPESRYQGWFITDSKKEEKIYKIIEDIRPVGRNEVNFLENKPSKVVRRGDGFEESFSLDSRTNRFIYELTGGGDLEIVLDMRDSYSDDYPEYNIEDLGGRLLIHTTGGNELFLAIEGYDSYNSLEERFVRNYELDKDRSSPPFEKAVFKALILKGERIVFSASKNKEKALNNLDKKIKIKGYEERKEPIDFVVAEKGLDNLVVEGEKIYAGFPWFFQFWQRDEAISLRGLNIINSEKARNVFWSLIGGGERGPRGNKIADGSGWTYKRAFLFLNDLSQKEEEKLVKHLREDVNFNPSQILKVTDKKETWMDSISREGARIEIQALQLAIYKLGRLLDKEKEDQYERMEKELRERVRDIFWDGSILADGYDPETEWVDKTIRPNIFLAYYIYPELLTDKDWKICFRRALYDLWLDWGGLSTISKEDPRYKAHHTGENPESYHQGDSWFFVNNLAAVAMNRLDEGKFSYEVNKILQASREDLLWNGAVGHHSEVSSAEIQKPEGAISQAWSFSSYLEAIHEIFKIKNFNWD